MILVVIVGKSRHRENGMVFREVLINKSRAPFHSWRKTYENASVAFVQKRPALTSTALPPTP